ncbi:MAG: TlpA disulfide reductase family protein [Thalassotalea sp.]
MARSIFIQIIILVIAFNFISYLREATMLSKEELVTINVEQLPTLMSDDILLQAQGKTTVLYFFAPWCSICHISIANLQSLYLNNPNLDVIAVALDYDNKQAVAAFSKQHQLTFPIALGNAKVKSDFKIKGYPSYYVLDKNNQISASSLGYSTKLGLYLRTL